jgi:putative transcriptional regulator
MKNSSRDARRDLGAELFEAIRSVKAGKVGRVNTVPVSIAVEARYRLGFSQSQLATLLGVPVWTCQDWERGRREPSGAAKTLLRIPASNPEVVHEALAKTKKPHVTCGDFSSRSGT